jgi:hypothetical protein
MEALDSLAQNVELLLSRYADLQRENRELREANENQRQEMMRTHSELVELQQRYRHLSQAAAMVGSPEERELAKRRLTALIDKVDKAIEVLKQ